MKKPLQLNRRQTVKALSAAGTIPFLSGLGGCGDGTGAPPLPENLPDYTDSETTGPSDLFLHGVASGDPTHDAVVLWTRVSPASSDPVDVYYEVALDNAFSKRVAAGTVSTNADRDFTIKIDIAGLVWGRDYFYRFRAQNRTSELGRTRIAPAPGQRTDHLRFGVCSCASLAHGYFHGYRWMAARSDLDAIFQLGDYIYEYGNNGYGDVRTYEPPHEIITLEDYRMRYAQYRRDPDLQLVHARHPFIVVWDDHETANNSYKDGAENHQPDTEGDWEDRKAAALQAYLEWLPIRETPATEDGRIYRKFTYGDLADVFFLDTRIAGRDEQLEFSLDEDTPDRSILGKEQEKWFADQLAAGSARWKVVAQQVVMAPTFIAPGEIINVVFDDWSGYPSAQTRMFDQLEPHSGSVVVLTGDIHSSWANGIARDPQKATYDPATDNFAVEFVTPGITSPGGFSGLVPAILENSPNIAWLEAESRGYMILNVQTDRVQMDWFHLNGVEENEGQETFAAGFASNYGSAVLVASEEAAG